MKKGFTLLELLVVVSIFAIVLSITFTFFSGLLSQTNKINIETEVKQNGQIVVELLSRQIRNAINASNPGSPPNLTTLELINQQGQINSFTCVFVAGQNGYIEDTTKSLSITNQDDRNGVSLSDCRLEVRESLISGAPKVVEITLTFQQAVNAPSRADFTANAEFRQTISLRNYQ